MRACKVKDTCGYLGTEPGALREELERLIAAVERAAAAEGAEAMKAGSDAAREILSRATILVDGLADKADAAKAAAREGRGAVEGAIRDKPLLAVGLAALTGFVLATLIRRR